MAKKAKPERKAPKKAELAASLERFRRKTAKQRLELRVAHAEIERLGEALEYAELRRDTPGRDKERIKSLQARLKEADSARLGAVAELKAFRHGGAQPSRPDADPDETDEEIKRFRALALKFSQEAAALRRENEKLRSELEKLRSELDERG